MRTRSLRTSAGLAAWLLLSVAAGRVGASGPSAGNHERRRQAPSAPAFAVATLPTPVLDTPDFRRVYGGRRGDRVHRDKVGLVREVETVCLPGSVFQVHEQLRGWRGLTYYRVTTEEYPFPTKKGYFVDARFVRPCDERPPERLRRLPSPAVLRYRLLSSVGALYVWGGNWRDGLPQLLDWYPARRRLDPTERMMWTLRGVDCSGLLYQATDGFTPRNASALVRFGRGLPVQGKTPGEIARLLEPFDLIVWGKHVVIALGPDQVIQSRTDEWTPGAPGGVRVLAAPAWLSRITRERTPVDDYDAPPPGVTDRLVVRRWYPEARP